MEIRVKPENSIYTTAEFHISRHRAMHLEQVGGHRNRLLVTGWLAARLTAGWTKCTTLVDIGCGDGGLLQLIKSFYDSVWGYDFQPTNVEGAIGRKVNVEYCDIIKDFDKMNLNADVGVLTEVLEHMDNPHEYLKKLINTPIKYLVLSSPINETENNHYEGHVWVWDSEGYFKMIDNAGWFIMKDFYQDGFLVVLATNSNKLTHI
jgi:2-polyprenyl-3-methyl-5-hydroxy-6-metoxy-1,4-benzoquinol methylase